MDSVGLCAEDGSIALSLGDAWHRPRHQPYSVH